MVRISVATYLQGGVTPLGGAEITAGYKGYGLGLMVEMLSGVLANSCVGPDLGMAMSASLFWFHLFPPYTFLAACAPCSSACLQSLLFATPAAAPLLRGVQQAVFASHVHRGVCQLLCFSVFPLDHLPLCVSVPFSFYRYICVDRCVRACVLLSLYYCVYVVPTQIPMRLIAKNQ